VYVLAGRQNLAHCQVVLEGCRQW